MRTALPRTARSRAYRLIAAVLLAVTAIPAGAEEYTFSADSADKYAVSNAYDGFINGLPDELLENAGDLLPEGGILDPDMNESLRDKLDLSLWIGKITEFVLSGAGDTAGAIVPLFSLVVLMAAANAILPESDIMKRSFAEYASLLCAVEIFWLTADVLTDARNYLSGLCGIMNLFLPVMESVCLLGGRLTEKAVSGGSMLLLTTLIGNFTNVILAPLVSLLFTFTAVTAACPDSKLGGMVSGIRKFIGRMWAIFGILFSFMLSVQNLLAASADNLGAKTARFALSSFIPMAGGMLAEALSTLRTGISYVRQAAGIGGIVVLLALFLPAVIPLVMYKLALSLTASAAEIMGVTAASGILGEVKGIVELILGVVVSASLLFLLALMMFMKVQAG